jgi:hypothetical protein
MPVEPDADGIIVHMNTLNLTSRVLIFLWLVCQIPVVDAARVTDLYSARVPAAEDSQRSQSETFDIALEKVLVKVTGYRGIMVDPVVMNRFATAETYVQQHRMNPDGSTWVRFDQVALRRSLDSVGQPVWGEERPVTLAWVVLDYGTGTRDILAAESDIERERGLFEVTQPDGVGDPERQAAVRKILNITAAERGLPLVLPLVDSEELGIVSIADVWGGFTESLVLASQRYGVDAILVGRVRVSFIETAEVRWILMIGDERFEWEGDIASGPDRIADFFAARFATSSSALGRMQLRVDGIGTLEEYGRLNRYISSLDVIEDYSVARVTDRSVILSLLVRGDADRLMRSIALRRVLQPVDSSQGVLFPPEPSMDPFGSAPSNLHYALIAGP